MTVSLTISGITFSSDPANPYSIGEDALEGWFSGAPIKTQPDDRANSDGVFGVTQFFRGARPFTLSGLFIGSTDEAVAFGDYRRLAGLLASGVPETVSVTDPSGTRTAKVMLFGSGSTLMPIVNGLASFVISFLAFDPVKYGLPVTQTTGLQSGGGGLEYPLHSPSGALYYGANGDLGRVTLTNIGTAEAWPTFLVTGGLTSGFFIQRLDTGQQIRYDRVVPAGGNLSIDSKTGVVLIDGLSDGSTYLTRDEWFSVPAMSSIDVQFNAIGGSSGTPLLAATISDGDR